MTFHAFPLTIDFATIAITPMRDARKGEFDLSASDGRSAPQSSPPRLDIEYASVMHYTAHTLARTLITYYFDITFHTRKPP